MKEESLEVASLEIIKMLHNLNIDQIDKVELMVNIENLLNQEEYDDNIDTLRVRQHERQKVKKLTQRKW